MLHHLFHPLRLLWDGRVTFFWPIWISITIIATVLTSLVVSVSPGEVCQQNRSTREFHWSFRSVFLLILLILVLVCYGCGIVVWEDFTYYDNSHFTNGTLIGENIALQVSPEGGRFWPLGHQEFSVLRHFTTSVRGYHSLRIVQLVIVCSILWLLDDELKLEARTALVFLFLITPSIVTAFSGLIYPEANVVYWLACFALCMHRFEVTHSRYWAMAAVICVQFMLYYKETVFLFVLGFCLARIASRCWTNEKAWEWNRLRDPESRLDLCIASLSVVFVLYYLAAMFPKFGSSYAAGRRLALGQILSMDLGLDLLSAVFVCVCLVRAFDIVHRKAAWSSLWDGLALGAICYLLGFLILRMESGYYLAAVDLVAILYVGRMLFLHFKDMGTFAKLCAVSLGLLIVLQDTTLSAFRMYERKNVVHAKAEAASAIKARYGKNSQNVRRIFFPFAKPFYILEFASYLQYVGVPIEQGTTGSNHNGVLLLGGQIEADGPCGYRAFLCHPGRKPESGDVVVVFPDDNASVDAIVHYQENSSAILLSYYP